MDSDTPPPPAVWAGPILRRVTQERLTLWLALRAPAEIRLVLSTDGMAAQTHVLDQGPALRVISAGVHLHYHLIDLPLDAPLPTDCWIDYHLSIRFDPQDPDGWQDHTEWAPDLCYPGFDRPRFRVSDRVQAILHGSCRKPHHDSGDGLVAADRHLADLLSSTSASDAPENTAKETAWPAMLIMSGDQIYADDVAGPMLRAIHALMAHLGLASENLQALDNPDVNSTEELIGHADGYYHRENLLPTSEHRQALLEILFSGIRKPVFTADAAHNHLITLGEVLAMYLLVWSPAGWQALPALTPPPGLTEDNTVLYDQEQRIIDAFVAGLAAVRRICAHLPVAMVFDDHDVTDDWNLNRDWEERAYDHPVSTRIIGNALLAYLLNQGWGNKPEAFDPALLDRVQEALRDPGSQTYDTLLEEILDFEGWDYVWDTDPAVVVLDTRTRRWRSETSGRKPSGLLDWEAVTDLQRAIRGRDSVILVSAAPIFGVKLIEAIQRFFTFIGKPLMVDAEYWMAHGGTAEAVLNVFRHRKTPDRFTILSGDVHYSFVYDVELRGRSRGPDIWQICSSGFKNRFPPKLLNALDQGNRWLFAPASPLNRLTKRRGMRVVPRKPEGLPHGRRLLDREGVGLVEFDEAGAPVRIAQLTVDGDVVEFGRREQEARWE